MLMMRLQRVGRRNEPHYKIVVIEKSRGPKSQKYIDTLGFYNPKMSQVVIKEDQAQDWLSKGVQPSDTVYNMLVEKGIIDGKKKNVLPKKSPTKKKNAPDEPEVKAPEPAPVADVEAEPEVSEEVSEAEAPEAKEAEAEQTAETPEAEEKLVEEPSADELEEAAEGTPEVPGEKEENQA